MMKSFPFALIFSLACFWLGTSRVFAQSPHRVSGQLLVRLADDAKHTVLFGRLRDELPQAKPVLLYKVSESLNVWLLEVVAAEEHERRALEWLGRQQEVRAVQFNRILEYRGQFSGISPNDPLYNQQWHHFNDGASGGISGADLDSELAWNITTGGLTALGDTIVVAVVDGGIEFGHGDLASNMWRNHHEIPNDGVDNDGNGYVDDFLGWNVFGNNDNIAGISMSHGTPVSALIGAKGNNGVGVTGVNWDTKIMFVAGNSQESVILSAYDYVLRARKRYNATNGQEGAFVVAVNCSWGITGGQPSSAPLWCAAFDSLGAAGILSVAATANSSVDVDAVGDLPTACPSGYLIAVTNLTRADQKADNAAWGATTIDLGAYGRDVFTARAGNTYGTFSGTSFAAPQVSGAIGLLYAAPCNNIAAMARANPGATALWVKSQLLGSTTANASLQNITVTGGRLNLFRLIQDYEDQCADCIPPFALSADEVSGNGLEVVWSVVSSVASVSLRWRKKGDTLWNLVPGATTPYLLLDLQTCSEYEFSLRATCTGNTWSPWTDTAVFETDGCCSPPTNITASMIGSTMAALAWDGPGTATEYRIRFRALNGNWLDTQSAESSIWLSELLPCTQYQVEITAECETDTSSTPSLFQFITGGCGACTDLTYCTAGASSAKDEWIAKVEIASWSHYSGGNVGYQNFTSVSGNVPEIMASDSLPITLTPGFSSLPYKEHFRVFIDYNADGDFDDPGELAFDPGFTTEMPISGYIVPPANIAPGLTRMRVMMKYRGPQGTAPTPCETFEFGQVVDYCVHLGPLVPTASLKRESQALLVYPQPAQQQIFVRLPSEAVGIAEYAFFDATGRELLRQVASTGPDDLALDVSGFPEGMFLLIVRHQERLYYQKIFLVRP
jgi:serine protease